MSTIKELKEKNSELERKIKSLESINQTLKQLLVISQESKHKESKLIESFNKALKLANNKDIPRTI